MSTSRSVCEDVVLAVLGRSLGVVRLIAQLNWGSTSSRESGRSILHGENAGSW